MSTREIKTDEVSTKTIEESNGKVVIDVDNNQIKNVAGTVVLDWNTQQLYDVSAVMSVDWANRVLLDADAQPSIEFGDGNFISLRPNTGAAQGKNLRWWNNDSSAYVQFRAPNSLTSTDYIWPGADGTPNQVLSTDSAGNLSWATAASGGWTKYQFTNLDFAAAATTSNTVLFSLPALGVIEAVIIQHTTAFTGGTITAYTLSVGISGFPTKYASAWDVFQTPFTTLSQSSADEYVMEDSANPTTVFVAATSVGDNLDNTVTGAVTIWVKSSTLP